ncbi:hypothetical protein B0H13DRAFT_1611741, partial [Mycena leptocephala]
FVCTDAGFTGSCSVFNGASGQCIELPGSFNEDITSIGPDPGQDCFFYMQGFLLRLELSLCLMLPYSDGGCTGGQLGPIRSPGSSNLNVAATVQFNDHISSFE